MIKRSAISIQQSVIWALVSRHIKTKFSQGYFSYAKMLIEPTIHVLLWVALFTFRGRDTILNFSIPLFIITGVYPFLLFRNIVKSSQGVVSSNAGLITYRQVKVIDVLLATVVFELFLSIVMFIISVLFLIWMGDHIVLYHPLLLVSAMFLIVFLALGFALLLAIVSHKVPEIKMVVSIVMRFLYLGSGVFFSLSNIPSQYQHYLYWNPLLQIIELCRYSFSTNMLPMHINFFYVFSFATIALWFGLGLYYYKRNMLETS